MKVNGDCYFIGRKRRTQISSINFCKNQGAVIAGLKGTVYNDVVDHIRTIIPSLTEKGAAGFWTSFNYNLTVSLIKK